MAKEISGFIKLQIKGGQANPAPPVGPALGQRGVNIMEFCKAFNDKTKSMAGKPVPVEITVYKDKKFDFKIKSPPASFFIKEAVKLKGGSKEPGRNIVASISKKQLEDIANQKMKDLNAHDLDEAVRVGHRIAIMRDGKVIQIGTPEEIVVSPADDYVADFVKGISRLKVVQAKSIMQSVKKFENQNGKLSNDLEIVNEGDLLSKLIETSASKDKPVIVHNSQNQVVGVISQSDLLKAVIDGGDGE